MATKSLCASFAPSATFAVWWTSAAGLQPSAVLSLCPYGHASRHHEHPVEGAHVGLRAGDDDVRIGAAAGVGAAGLLDADGHIALGIDALRDAFHRELR